MKKILILFGGNSYEHLVSCKSAKTIMENIDKKKYDVTLVGITKSNTWYIYNDLLKYLDNELWYTKNVIKIDNIISFLKTFDKVFPIIHGNPLENGNLQGLLNMFNIKYVGSNLEESSICYDKEITKIILNNYNINQVPYKVILNKKDDLKLNFDFPVIVKPSRCGSSIGINIAYNNKELKKYIKEAFKYDNKVIVEKYIKDNLELECSILENKKLLVSTVGMIKPINKFYDYEAKYEKTSNLIIPALINKELEKSNLDEDDRNKRARNQAIEIAKIAEEYNAKDLRDEKKVGQLKSSIMGKLTSGESGLSDKDANKSADGIISKIKKIKGV